MSKLIDKDALVAEIERLHKAHSGKYGCDEVGLNLEYLEDFIDTLEVKEMESEEIKTPRWFLENVENTLRIQYNINLEKNGETCQDRNIKESLNGVRKLLNGKELTGMERLEKLIPYTLEVKKVDLNEEIEKCLKQHSMLAVGKKDFADIAKYFYSLGLKAQKE